MATTTQEAPAVTLEALEALASELDATAEAVATGLVRLPTMLAEFRQAVEHCTTLRYGLQ